VLTHGRLHILHTAFGRSRSGHKHKIKATLFGQPGCEGAVSLPYYPAGTISKVCLADFFTGRDADTIYAEAVFAHVSDEDRGNHGGSAIEPPEIGISV